jgi:phage gpG-like protein
VNVSFEMLGTEHLNLTLSRWIDHSLDVRPALAVVARDFRSIETKQFDSQGGYLLGARWAKLAEPTLEYKRKHPEWDRRILHRTRALRKSLTVGTGGAKTINRDSLQMGSNIPYSGFHQSGTVNMPQRIIFKFTPQIKRRWAKIIQTWIVTGKAVRIEE